MLTAGDRKRVGAYFLSVGLLLAVGAANLEK
jgi:hypothetical protein